VKRNNKKNANAGTHSERGNVPALTAEIVTAARTTAPVPAGTAR